jgi:hypothetical protein
MKNRIKTGPAGVFAALAASLCIGGAPALAETSADGVWSAEIQMAVATAETSDVAPPTVYRIDHKVLESLLEQVPAEGMPSEVRLSVPAPDGSFRVFRIERSSVLGEELAARYPDIATFRGQVVDGEPATIRVSRTPRGFHATVVSTDGVFFVERESHDQPDRYVITRAEGPLLEGFECLSESLGAQDLPGLGVFSPMVLTPSGDGVLRQYRLAVATKWQYTSFFGGRDGALAQVAETVNAVNAIFNIDIATHLVLVDNNDEILFRDADEDPITGNLNSGTQAAIDDVIGSANYDIGHLFHRAGTSISGNAGGIGTVCRNDLKGSAWSQGPNPANANFVFLVAHEMGHQWGANHTWNGTGCGTEESVARYEPGSGTTIMSYSSICGADNIQGTQVGDLYFHAGSRAQIGTYLGVGDGNTCGTVINTTNQLPTVSAGNPYTIPRGTPFVLTAVGSDPDPGNTLTYTWEQYDIGNKAALSAVDNGSIPLFRSFSPTTSPSRTFPQFSDLLAGSSSLFPSKLGEQLPSTDRMLTFRVTVRDNVAGGGAADADETVLNVVGDPFRLTSPAFGGWLECNVPTDVEWEVGGGDVAQFANLFLSRDGGASFTPLASDIPNQGDWPVTVGEPLSNDARLRLDAVNNIFFALSDPIAVADTLPPEVTAPPAVVEECTGHAGTPVDIGLGSASDMCEGALPTDNDAPALFQLGETIVTWSAQDSSGNVGSDTQSVTIVDTTPPEISISLSRTVLWPPNHAMIPITVDVTVEDICDPSPTVQLVSITSNEPDNGLGDGNTSPDIQDAEFGTDDRSFLLRAERSGRGTGRIYTITYRASDSSGNWAEASAEVLVPRNR